MEINGNIRKHEEAKYCSGCGHLLASYISVVNEPNTTVGPALNNVVPPPIAQQPAVLYQAWVTMEEAAKMMRYSYFWLAHNWKRLELHPSDFGHRRMFEVAEINECLQRNRFTYRGRPRKR